MGSFRANGKQVLDPAGQHFADAASPVAALLIVCALEVRKHRPAIDGDRVVCSRCQNELPHDGAEPCIPRTPRCKNTPDMFEDPDIDHKLEVDRADFAERVRASK